MEPPQPPHQGQPPQPPPPPVPYYSPEGAAPPAYRQKPIGQDAGMRLLLPVGRSVWAILAGYLGLFIIPGPLALIASFFAIRDIRNSRNTPEPKHGMGRVVMGIVGGIIGTVGWIAIIYASKRSS